MNGVQNTNLQFMQLILHTISQKDIADVPDFAKQVLIQLCELAAKSTDVSRFGATTASILYILKERPFLATQHGIDVLLGTLTTLSSSRAPALPFHEAAFIYARLCQLATAVILLHRKKLGGRMHLVVALLQNMLACLFSPYHYSTAAIAARPEWLKAATSSGADATHILSTDHATAYARILTTLCQPTVSSAISHRGYRMASEALVSETARAKEYAGQYVGYILLLYCTLQLQGKIVGDGPDMGDKLKQGIWAVMETVNIEAMRGMNAGMSKEERVIWSDLYAEWNRVGRSRQG
jgi:nucleolar pre-ribosomal-associated protein 2